MKPWLQEKAAKIYQAALAAVSPRRLIKENVRLGENKFSVCGQIFNLAEVENVYLISAGKAARGMAQEMAEMLGEKLDRGLVVSPDGEKCQIGKLKFIRAGHPLPDEESVQAAENALEIARQSSRRDMVVICLSGGASSLLALPAGGITLKEKALLIKNLLLAGANIHELNTVRKHISGIKGGLLARAIWPATALNLVISDVVGNDLKTIASGLVHWDTTTFTLAKNILMKYAVWRSVSSSIRDYIEAGISGKVEETARRHEKCFRKIKSFIVGSNRVALNAGAREAGKLGFATSILTDLEHGEARKVAASYYEFMCGLPLRYDFTKPRCFLSGGELSVTVRGKGIGGRNSEFVLALAVEMLSRGYQPDFDWLVLSLGTDGIDGPTDAAGAWLDSSTYQKIARSGLDAASFLGDNNAYSFFEKTGNLIKTGPTGTNVMDLRLVLTWPRS